MRTMFLAMLLAVAAGCGGSGTEDSPVPAQTGAATAEVDFEDTAHYRVLDQILLRMIGEDYRESDGDRLYRLEASRIFLGVTNIKAPDDSNPDNPEIEWRLVFPLEEPDDDSFAGWSFVKGRWDTPPIDPHAYDAVANEFLTIAHRIVTPSESVALGRLAIELAERAESEPGGKTFRSEPLILESGYRCVVEFMRAPDSPTNSWPEFHEVVIKFAPVELPKLPKTQGSAR